MAAREGHFQYEGAEEAIEEVLLEEAPSRPEKKFRWKVAGVAVVMLAVVGFAAKTVFPSSLSFMTSEKLGVTDFGVRSHSGSTA
eukprot:s1855_g1.t1